MIECLERPLHIDEVREGLPEIGWTVVREDEDHNVEADLPGMEPGLYRTLVAEAAGTVAFIGYFNDGGELLMQEYQHLRLDTSLPLPNAQHGVFSAEWARQVLTRLSEGAIGPPDNWRPTDGD